MLAHMIQIRSRHRCDQCVVSANTGIEEDFRVPIASAEDPTTVHASSLSHNLLMLRAIISNYPSLGWKQKQSLLLLMMH
jgi:hypothetical protein